MTPHRTGFGWLFWNNALTLGAYGLFLIFDLQNLIPGGQWLKSLLTLIIAFGVLGQNVTALSERFLKAQWSLIEKIVVLWLVALIFVPLSVTLLAPLAGSHLAFVPILMAALSWILAMQWHPWFWESAKKEPLSPHWLPGLIIGSILWGVFVFQFVSAYYALPDLDPYYWLQKFQQDFSQDTVVPLGLHRPLFSSFGYIFFQTAGIDLYAFFKYLLPLSFLSLLLPLSLLATRARTLGEAILVFALPAASSSFLLYTLASLPQSIANLLIVSALILIIHTFLTRQPFFFWLVGGILFGATLYHEISLLFLLLWIGCALWFLWPRCTSLLRDRWLIGLLLSILFVTYFGQAITSYALFLESWFTKIFQALFTHQPNWAFPATYINIDGNPVGWSNWWGVTRYYLFYFGPLALGGIVWGIWMWISRKQILAANTLFGQERRLETTLFAFLTVSALVFLTMAEFFPRFFNLALLPERALGFFALITLSIGYLILLRLPAQLPTALTLIGIMAVCINTGGALYINSIKQHLITPNQITTAEWIRGALPKERIIFTGKQFNLLRFHSQTKTVIEIEDPLFYQDIRVFDTSLRRLPSQDEQTQFSYQHWIGLLKQSIADFQNLSPGPDWEAIRVITQNLNQSLKDFSTWQQSTVSDMSRSSLRPPLYIYFSQESAKNPYTERPYMQAHQSANGEPLIFDQYPDRFQRIYALPENEIVIWKLIQ